MSEGNLGKRRGAVFVLSALAAVVVAVVATALSGGTGWKIVGWNNLGMHCMDADFGVFAILPPYNTIEAQVIDPSGNLVPGGSGITVTYEAVADPSGSINTTSQGKTNFWQNVQSLFGVSLPVDAGLAGKDMPGASNTPQPMSFDSANGWFVAEGIPLTPYDDAQHKNYYPLMRLTAKDGTGATLATTDIVLPISDEMDCSACHASGSGPAARPASGWVDDPDPQRDYRLNILLLHDDRQLGNPTYQAALAARGYNAGGLYSTVVTDGKSILCATCHLSEALPGTGYAGVPALTAAMHTLHASVIDPTNGMTLDSSNNRSACYRCHPGSTTRCLRGAMGNAVAADGTMAIQCQNCHGPMSTVGDANRTGWLQEPSCQQCHTGTATHNNGLIRYTSAFDAGGQPRVAVDSTFATNPDTPAAGFDLYRFSQGHGGLQCEACHGATHAEYPSSHLNDNLQNIALQGHAGVLAECSTCHPSGVSTVRGGPHGMHPVGQSWVSSHGDAAEGGTSQCQACHGSDYRGTVLSRAFGDRSLSTEFGAKTFWRGFQVGCYTCHNGPQSESANPNHAPVVQDLSAATQAGAPVAVSLHATDADGNPLTLRIVSQPQGGTVGLGGSTATYFPFPDYAGTDAFTYAANDGQTDSNLGHVTVTVSGGSGCTLTCNASAPASAAAGAPVTFTGSASPSGCTQSPAYDWDFGDGSPHSSAQNPSHTYAAGTYAWTFTASEGSVVCTQTGTITVSAAPGCSLTCSATAPSSATAGSEVGFQGTATLTGCSGEALYQWSFGDGGSSSDEQPSHVYSSAGTFAWTLTVTADGETCSRSGSIVVSAPNPGPSISEIDKLDHPFQIKILGGNFAGGVVVFIGSDASPWANTVRQSANSLLLKGSGLKAKFPHDVQVAVKVQNPDGQYDVAYFKR